MSRSEKALTEEMGRQELEERAHEEALARVRGDAARKEAIESARKQVAGQEPRPKRS